MPATFLQTQQPSMPSSRISRTTLLRLGLVLLVSLLIHLALFDALPRLPRWKSDDEQPIIASIVTPPETKPLIAPPTPPTLIAPLAPLPRPHLERAIQKAEARPATLSPEPVQAAPPPVINSDNGATSLATAGASDSQNSVPVATAPAPGDAPALPALPVLPALPAPPAPSPPAARPVDAVLEYRVTALDPKKPDQSLVGRGTLSFHSDADHYRATLDAHIQALFFSLTALTSESVGQVGSDGLEPQQYSEKTRNKPSSTASFRRDANGSSQISFSQGADVLNAAPGVQDRLTILLQVGALMQVDSTLKQTGAHFSIPVAGLKGNVDAWNFTVRGLEAVPTDIGSIDGWHVARVLRPGSNDRGIEIWVSNKTPSIPLRVRYSEPDGSSIDLLLASQS